jgi:PKHD-type hydroxylase
MLYPIPPREIPNTETIAYWENFLSKEDIDLILSQPEWDNLSHGIAGGRFEPEIRLSNVAFLSRKPEIDHIWEKFANVTARVNSEFFHFDLEGFYEPMQLAIYDSSDKGHYDWHIDAVVNSNLAPRKLSIAMLLSDTSEFEGGEFQVKTNTDIAKTLQTKQGRAWFFPSYTLHRVAPVTKGIRRSLVLWVGGPPFK